MLPIIIQIRVMKHNIGCPFALVLLIAVCFLQVHSSNTTVEPYCSPSCASYVGACFGPGPNECWACSTSLFLLQRNSSGVCETKSQHQVVFYELKNSAMDLSGYSTSKPAPQICDQYTLSGQYVAGDFIQKTFTGIPANHYQLVIRFGVGYIGTWNPTDQMNLEINGSPYSWLYHGCSYPQDLCSTSTADCFKIVEQVITHDTTNLTLKFSSSIAEVNPSVQYWGIKDLTIGVRTCHARCQTCFGPAYSECKSCALGYYLLGNLCVPECQFYVLVDKRMCIEECPSGFYGHLTTKSCETCQKDCLVCNDGNNCQVWSNSKDGLIWEQNKFFWILLIIIGLLVFLFLLWKVIDRKSNRDSKVEDSSQLKKSIISDDSSGQGQKIDKIQPETGIQQQQQKLQTSKSNNLSGSYFHLNKHEVVFQEHEVPWEYKAPPIVDVMENNNGYQIPKRKKKRFRPTTSIDQSSMSIPSTIQLDGTHENLKL